MKICPACQKTFSDDFVHCRFDGSRLAERVAPDDVELAAQISPRFRIIRRLGVGGMGTVFLAQQTDMGDRPVALKVVSRRFLEDPEFLHRFRVEGAATGRIRHTNVVTVYESREGDDGTPYIAMEFLDGESLREALRGALKGGHAFSVTECSEILMQVARGLNAAHKMGILHRDIKPDNIFLTHGDEGALLVKVVDFGIAKLRDSAFQTPTGRVLGTPPYMSYDQASGMGSDQLDERTDVYSLGVVVYEMLTGRLPFQSNTPAGYLAKHLMELPPPFSAVAPGLSISAGVEAVVMKALTKNRQQRYRNALEFARDFASAASASSQAATTDLPPTVIATRSDWDGAEQERLAQEKAEADRRENERAAELAARENAEQERLAQEKAETAFREHERHAEQEAREKVKQEQLTRKRAEAERLSKEQAEAEQAERERLAFEKAEAERREKERAAAEQSAREKVEQERLAREKAEAERRELERAAAEQAARDKDETDPRERERVAIEQALQERERAAAEQALQKMAQEDRHVIKEPNGDQSVKDMAAGKPPQFGMIAEQSRSKMKFAAIGVVALILIVVAVLYFSRSPHALDVNPQSTVESPQPTTEQPTPAPETPAPAAQTTTPAPQTTTQSDSDAADRRKQVEDALRQGDRYYGNGAYDQAINAYQGGLNLDPSNEGILKALKRAQSAKAAEAKFNQ